MVISFISVILILLVFNAIRISRKRFIIRNELRGVYSRMELELVKNQVRMDNATISYLTGYKNIIVNPRMADIQVITAIVMTIPKQKLESAKEKNRKVESKLSPAFMELVAEFDKGVESLIKLSTLRPDFVIFFARILVRLAWWNFYEDVWKSLTPQNNEAQLINYVRLQVA